jgi:hypothetical protein
VGLELEALERLATLTSHERRELRSIESAGSLDGHWSGINPLHLTEQRITPISKQGPSKRALCAVRRRD